MGNALITGQKYSKGEFIFYLDCDNSVNSNDIMSLIEAKNKNSLVIGDEVCSGTEVESATSIIVASLKHLYKHFYYKCLLLYLPIH